MPNLCSLPPLLVLFLLRVAVDSPVRRQLVGGCWQWRFQKMTDIPNSPYVNFHGPTGGVLRWRNRKHTVFVPLSGMVETLRL